MINIVVHFKTPSTEMSIYNNIIICTQSLAQFHISTTTTSFLEVYIVSFPKDSLGNKIILNGKMPFEIQVR